MNRIALALLSAAAVLTANTAFAHYLWLNVDRKTDEVNLYFEEGPAPGTGEYLGPIIEKGKSWVRSGEGKEAASVKMESVKENGKHWLSGKLPAGAPRSAETSVTWGVYPYGKTNVLLHYYARHIEADSAAALAKLAPSEKMQLNVEPSVVDGKLKVLVTWRGKPAANRQVLFWGPGVKADGKTDEQGQTEFEIGKAGLYRVRTNVEEPKESGTYEGKDYDLKRHHASVTMRLPLGGE